MPSCHATFRSLRRGSGLERRGPTQEFRAMDPLRHPTSAQRFAIARQLRRATTPAERHAWSDRKSTRLNSSHTVISYAVFCLKKKKKTKKNKYIKQHTCNHT